EQHAPGAALHGADLGDDLETVIAEDARVFGEETLLAAGDLRDFAGENDIRLVAAREAIGALLLELRAQRVHKAGGDPRFHRLVFEGQDRDGPAAGGHAARGPELVGAGGKQDGEGCQPERQQAPQGQAAGPRRGLEAGRVHGSEGRAGGVFVGTGWNGGAFVAPGAGGTSSDVGVAEAGSPSRARRSPISAMRSRASATSGASGSLMTRV